MVTGLPMTVEILMAAASMFFFHELGHFLVGQLLKLELRWKFSGLWLVWMAQCRPDASGARPPMTDMQKKQIGAAGFALSILGGLLWIHNPVGLIAYLCALAAHFFVYATRPTPDEYDDFNLIRPR